MDYQLKEKRNLLMGFLRHKGLLKMSKGCHNDNPSSFNFLVDHQPNPDKLLPSRAYFRFSLTVQKYKV